MKFWVKWQPANGTDFFKEEEFEDGDERSGWPSTLRNETLNTHIREVTWGNHPLTVRELAEGIGIYDRSCHAILTEDLGMYLSQQNLCQGFSLKIRVFDTFQLQISPAANKCWSYYYRRTVHFKFASIRRLIKCLTVSVNSATCEWWSTKKGTGNVDCRNVACPSQHTPADTALLMWEVLAKHSTPVLPQPLY
jgi:hypothetical protein